jgi:hypothetical protein
MNRIEKRIGPPVNKFREKVIHLQTVLQASCDAFLSIMENKAGAKKHPALSVLSKMPEFQREFLICKKLRNWLNESLRSALRCFSELKAARNEQKAKSDDLSGVPTIFRETMELF